MAKLVYYDDDGERCSQSFSQNVDIHELMTVFVQLALAMGYHYESVKSGFSEKTEEFDAN